MTDAGHSETPEPAAPEASQSSSAPAEPGAPEAPAPEQAPVQEAQSAPAPVPVPVSSVVHKHFVAPAMIPLERITDDAKFRVRLDEEMEDIAGLATDIARLGQLFPIDVRLQPPDQFQVITGFRRVAALRFLQREKVLARLHTDLGDGDAMLMALAAAIHGRSVTPAALAAVRTRLDQAGQLSPAARDMLDKSLSTESGLGPEQVEEEVDADELAAEVTVRLGDCNADLNLLADVFGELDDERKSSLLQQLRYSIQLVEYLESRR